MQRYGFQQEKLSYALSQPLCGYPELGLEEQEESLEEPT